MADTSPLRWWRRLLALPNESRVKTLFVALVVALVCASAVSLTAVLLKPRQEANQRLARLARMEQMIAALPGVAKVMRAGDMTSLQTVIVDLERGAIAPNIDPVEFDFRAAIADQERGVVLERDSDIARIGRRPQYAPVYLLRKVGKLALVILPVYGAGYQSMIHAYLALAGDLRTIAAFNIVEQGETPGLGARIADPSWQSRWSGREIADADGVIRIAVTRGSATTIHEVDGISGATRSTTGVTNLVRFWLGEQGYGPFLRHLAGGGSQP
ncbi:MAG: NADH:ubiquinone reductase (Na(+)-transporting) subunit C [Burkholderiaceae bacterium]|nr:NADH:ubiquinone reductase (Na(+)-transporting) subunit C [Burkholderiaceae bacterium]